ncbi:MAG TPA: BamA/TamA family outer membrane protein [Kofleriaceae bacterium]
MRLCVVLVLVALASTASADEPVRIPGLPGPPIAFTLPEPPAAPPKPIRRFVVHGKSKVTPATMGYLSHHAIGDLVSDDDIPALTQAFISSELFAEVTVELRPNGDDAYDVVVTVRDKWSWIAAPAVFFSPGNRAVGVGYAENDFAGLDRKFLLYAQLGTATSMLFGTFLDPSYHGTKLTWRADVYAYRRQLDEYVNDHGSPESDAIYRTTTVNYIGAGALVGWNFRWWLVGDLRLRGAYVFYRDPQFADGSVAPMPEKDGWDWTIQAHLTLDARHHYFGVTWGPYVQLTLEPSVPVIDSYDYQHALLRAYYSWRFFKEHQLELRTNLEVGRHLPAHEEATIGGVIDLRGYDVDQFRGDTRATFRVEYSVPIVKIRSFAFRAIGFWDTGAVAFNFRRTTDRDYTPEQLTDGYARNDVGIGLRVYLKSIVLPLVGLDFAYGVEGHLPEIVFEVGLTDF